LRSRKGRPLWARKPPNTKQFIAAVEALAAYPQVDALLVSPGPATPTLDILAPDLIGQHPENMDAPGSLAQELIRVFRAPEKLVVVTVDSGRLYDAFVTRVQCNGIAVWRKIDRASRALSAPCTM